jgi:hypothetical protein
MIFYCVWFKGSEEEASGFCGRKEPDRYSTKEDAQKALEEYIRFSPMPIEYYSILECKAICER